MAVSLAVSAGRRTVALVIAASTAEVSGDPGKRLPRELSYKYLGEDPPPEPDELRRVIVRVIPERVNSFSA